MLLCYLIGVPTTVPVLILATRLERSPNGDDPGWFILLLSFLWPLSVPIYLCVWAAIIIDWLVKYPAQTKSVPVTFARMTTCRRCSTLLPSKGKFCPHCGKRKRDR